MDELNQEDALALVGQAETEGMELWSEIKRKEFADLFTTRSEAARYILLCTAGEILRTAENRRFIGGKHLGEFREKNGGRDVEFGAFHTREGNSSYSCLPNHIGGRAVSDLNKIAEARAELILKQLPPLRKVVQIIDIETAKRLDRRDALLKKAKELKGKLDESSGCLNMAELDQDMSIRDFRKMVKDRDKKRRDLVTELNEVGKEGNELDTLINKRLYEGLPGLSNAVIKVALEHVQKATALDTTSRRVTERVIFGDSQTALELLKGFEKDEVKVSENIANQFKEALEKLKLSGLKRKQLKAKK